MRKIGLNPDDQMKQEKKRFKGRFAREKNERAKRREKLKELGKGNKKLI